MTHVLVAADLPGLPSALDTALQGAKGLIMLTDAVDIHNRLTDETRPVDVVVLDTAITPYPERWEDATHHPALSIESTLWNIIYLAGTQQPPARTLLLLHEGQFAPQIRDELIASTRKFGGSTYMLPRQVGPADQVQAVQWAISELKLTRKVDQHWLIFSTTAGGVGKSTQQSNIAYRLKHLGFSVLQIDADFANGSLQRFYKVPRGAAEPFMTLRKEFMKLPTMYPLEAVQRRIYHHPSGIDLLLSGRGVTEFQDMTTEAMESLLATVRQLPYTFVFLDAGGDIKARPYLISVLRAGGTSVVMCPPDPKGLGGAQDVLELMRNMTATGRNASMIEQAAVLFMQETRGSVCNVHEVQRDIMHQYPNATDLGIIPHDPRTISLVAVSQQFCTVYDIAPKSAYCTAVNTAVERLLTHLHIAPPVRNSTLHDPQAHRSDARSGGRGLWGLFGKQQPSI